MATKARQKRGKRRDETRKTRPPAASVPEALPTDASASGAAFEPSLDTIVAEHEDDRVSEEVRGSHEAPHDVAEISAYVPDHDGTPPSDPEPVGRDDADAQREPMGDVGDELRAVEAEVDRIFFEQRSRPRKSEDSALRSVVDRIREAIPVELPGEDGGPRLQGPKLPLGRGRSRGV